MEEKSMTLEEAFRRLDEILAQMQKPDLPLEESFKLYEEGSRLLAFCNSSVDTIEKKMIEIQGDKDHAGI